jgi:hypothetical protein
MYKKSPKFYEKHISFTIAYAYTDTLLICEKNLKNNERKLVIFYGWM